MLKFTLRVLGALLIGAILSIWVIQNNIHVQQAIQKQLLSLIEKEWNVTIESKGCRINFFTCSLFFNKGKVTPKRDRNFAWQFHTCKIHVSPLALLLEKAIYLDLTFYGLKGHTNYSDDQCDLWEHLVDIFTTKAPNIKISPSSINLHDIDLDVFLPNNKLSIALAGSFFLTKDNILKKDQAGTLWKGYLESRRSTITYNDISVIQNITGLATFYKNNQAQDWVINLDNKCQVQQVNAAQTYSIRGRWDAQCKQLEIHNANKSTQLAVGQDQHAYTLKGSMLLEHISQFAHFLQKPDTSKKKEPPIINGTCQADLALTIDQKNISGTGKIALHDITCKKFSIPSLELNLVKTHDKKTAAAPETTSGYDLNLTGTSLWNFEQNRASLSFTSNAPIKPLTITTGGSDAWLIAPEDLNFTLQIDKEFNLSGAYQLALSDQKIKKKYHFDGSYALHDTICCIDGKTKRGFYEIKATVSPQFYLSQWTYTINHRKLIDLKTTGTDKTLRGTVSYSLFRPLLDQSMRRIVLGKESALYLTLKQDTFDYFVGSLKLHEGRLYIPENRNLIEHFKTLFYINISQKKILLRDLQIDFCKGHVSCPRATLSLNDDYSPRMIHAPIQIDNLFVNWKRDFYGFVYGNLLLNKLPDSGPKLSGHLILKKSLLRENIFSEESNNSLYGPLGGITIQNQPLEFDIRVSTEKPIKARTSSLETYAHVDLNVHYVHNKELIQSPRVTGTINLEHGFLQFLHNKLFIEYGKIQFIPNQMNDPIIDLIAKNRINKYLVSLQATGSLQKPNIILESTPELTEEQILGLLLAGSENATLQADLPTILMHNLHTIVFGSKKYLPRATNLLEKIARPLKYVQISPSFTDQSGRGGIRGTVSVNLNEQLHAQIQKNFNLQEDFSAQIEYLLTDDINVKVIKDQRGELGSEVEVRLKL